MSASPIIVTKASGEKVPFIEAKLRTSLENAGASPQSIDDIVEEVYKILVPGISTKKIYQRAFQLLKNKHKPCAARYKLKRALMELGPSGYPFERFVGEVMKARGYQTEVGITLEGKCISHEVDVLAEDQDERIAMECKYGNSKAKKVPSTTAMYVHSRMRDLWAAWEQDPAIPSKRYRGFIVTNVKFTGEAIRYAKCCGELELLGWDYPHHENLRTLLDKHRLFPITVLTSLTAKQKRELLDQGIILCRHLFERMEILEQMGITGKRLHEARMEVEGLCG